MGSPAVAATAPCATASPCAALACCACCACCTWNGGWAIAAPMELASTPGMCWSPAYPGWNCAAVTSMPFGGCMKGACAW